MARLIKCYGTCNQKYPKEELQKIGTLNYCISCHDEKIKLDKDRKILYDTIQKIFKIPYPNGMMLRQIKMFKEDRNYTYEGMTKALCYFVKVQKITPMLGAALAFMPYHYDNAIRYYEELEERRRNHKEKEVEVVKKTMKPLVSNSQRVRERVIIKMEGLLNDG